MITKIIERAFPTLLNTGITIAGIVPHHLQKIATEHILKEVFKELLDDGELDFIEDKIISINVLNKNLNILLTIEDNTVIIKKDIDYDAKITASAEDFILIAARRVDPDTLFFQRRLLLEGDTDLSHGFKNILDSLELDDLPPSLRVILEKSADLVEKDIENKK